ncbi:hypothetical protein Ocin01_06201 [Orchesella cincta]|uniref:Uncharacterized protein n=1 Tax=Orchesella cincta TaxID=48709 RepID=A0A1D2N5E8_ORCCI|nr:hypothetical protein Ocin01_06201 [Orchesella cincta]
MVIRFKVPGQTCSGHKMFILSVTKITAGIDCFKCVSLNGDNPSEDPFHNNYSISILESPCMGGRKGRNGLFPATACIKLAADTGESMVVRTCAVDSGTLTLDTELARMNDTGETITVRGCALDSGTLNVDTEIIRMSHCGHFWFDDRYVKGCLQSCDDADGCNGSSRPKHFSTSVIVLLLLTSIGFPAYFLTCLGTRSHCGIRVT